MIGIIIENNHLCPEISKSSIMSGNVVNTIGHHVCKSGNKEYLLKNAPFYSVCTPETEDGKEPFLGNGYYLWDYNLETAHWWGNSHYKGDYSILSYPLTLSGDNFLDLVGSRQDMENFKKLVDKVRSKPGCEAFGISKCILTLEKLNSEDGFGGIFDYKVIRAVDITMNRASEIYDFASKRDGTTNLNPKILICFKDKNDIPLHQAEVVYDKDRRPYYGY